MTRLPTGPSYGAAPPGGGEACGPARRDDGGPTPPVGRRCALGLMGAGLGSALLAPLLPAPARALDDPNAAGGLTPRDRCLILWTTDHEPHRQRVMAHIGRYFTAYSGGIEVQVQAVEENALPEAVLGTLGSDEAPDLINTGSDVLLALHARGVCDDSFARGIVDHIGRERFFAGTLQALEGAGDAGTTPVAVPLHGWIQALWYRKDHMAGAGLAPPGALAALVPALERLRVVAQERQAPMGSIITGTNGDFYTQQCFIAVARAMGVRLFDAADVPMLDAPEVIETLDLYRRLAAFTPPGRVTWRYRDYFLQGRATMMMYSTFIMDDLALPSVAANSLESGRFPDLTGAPFDPELMGRVGQVTALVGPRGQRGAYSSVSGVALTRGGSWARRTWASLFVRTLFRPDVYITWLHMAPGGMLPVVRGIAETDAFLREPSGVFRRFGRARVRALAEGLRESGAFAVQGDRVVPAAGSLYASGILGRMVAAVIHEGADPVARAKQANAEAWSLLEATPKGSGRGRVHR